MVSGNGGTGYIRFDWFTPDGLPTWGDGRLTVLGTDGYIEVRKYVDIGGREGGSHLFLVDGKVCATSTARTSTSHTDVSSWTMSLNRTETAMPQAHCFLAMELALRAQKQAKVLS